MDKLKKCVSSDLWNDYSVAVSRRRPELATTNTVVPADDVTTGH